MKENSKISMIGGNRNMNEFAGIMLGSYVDYHPDFASYNTRPEYTGTQGQLFETQKTGWRIFSVSSENEKITIVSEKNVNPDFILRGRIGYENGAEELNELSKVCYSSRKYGVVASCLNVADVNEASGYKAEGYPNSYYWYNIRKFNPLITKILGKEGSWLASNCIDFYSPYAYFCMRFVETGCVRAACLESTNFNKTSKSYGIRPKVVLPLSLFDMSYTFFDGSSPERALKLIEI